MHRPSRVAAAEGGSSGAAGADEQTGALIALQPGQRVSDPMNAVRGARQEGSRIDIKTTTLAGAALEPGRVLRARYQIESCLGVGARGAVFRARDLLRKSLLNADQYVALKVLHADAGQIDETLEHLRHELQCAQTLSHANIVSVYELDRDGDVVFYTMELLDGELLSAVLARHRPEPMDRKQAWQLIRQIGAGVQHAHERGVVHGDLKPANIMITRQGEVRILDFGASRRLNPDQGATAGSGRSSATLAYASCEQLDGRPAGPRDDLYAVACICFELLAAAHPFGRRPASLVRDFGVQPKRPPGLGLRQWRTLQSGLSFHRAGRSLSAQDFVQRLVGDRDQSPRGSRLAELRRPHPSQGRARAPLMVLAALLAVGACVSQWSATPGPAAAPLVETEPAANQAVTWWSNDADESAAPVQGGHAEPSADREPEPIGPVRSAMRRPPLTIAVQGYDVGTGDRFVEIRVARNASAKNGTFTWWTETASARQGVDYVAQSKAIQTFGGARRSTRLYVKLLPDSQRSEREFFYLAIAQPGAKRPDAVTRTQIWLPIPRGQLRAQR